MHAQKISISLPQQQYDFIKNYQAERHYKSRSDVIRAALQLLQQSQLEAYYLEANQEIDDAFNVTSSDGLEENEAW